MLKNLLVSSAMVLSAGFVVDMENTTIPVVAIILVVSVSLFVITVALGDIIALLVLIIAVVVLAVVVAVVVVILMVIAFVVVTKVVPAVAVRVILEVMEVESAMSKTLVLYSGP